MEKIKAVVVDGHPVVLDGVTLALNADGRVQVVARARSLHECLPIVERHCPDVIVLAWLLTDAHGEESIPAIRRVCPECKVVILTHTGPLLEETALALGASAFITKDCDPRKIAETVCGLIDRMSGSTDHALTHKELEVATLAAEGMSNDGIAEALSISLNTVKTHLSHIFSKLGIPDRGGLANLLRQYDKDA